MLSPCFHHGFTMLSPCIHHAFTMVSPFFHHPSTLHLSIIKASRDGGQVRWNWKKLASLRTGDLVSKRGYLLIMCSLRCRMSISRHRKDIIRITVKSYFGVSTFQESWYLLFKSLSISFRRLKNSLQNSRLLISGMLN